MPATLLIRNRIAHGETQFAEIVVWRVTAPVPGSNHAYKYRLAFVLNGECVLRYDNEAGKGDHRHVNGAEKSYQFSTLDKLFADFERDIRRQQDEDPRS